MFPQKKQTEMHIHTSGQTDRQTDRQTDGGLGEYNKTSGVCVCLIYQYKRVNMCRDVCALFLETSASFLKPYTLNTSEATFPPLKISSQRKRKRKKMTIQTTVSSLLGVFLT